MSEPLDVVIIGREEYESLKRSQRFLIALQDAGVDNWSGYDYVNWDYVDRGEGNASKIDD